MKHLTGELNVRDEKLQSEVNQAILRNNDLKAQHEPILIVMEAEMKLTATIILVSTNAVSNPVHIVNVISLITIEFVLCRKYRYISNNEQKRKLKRVTNFSETLGLFFHRKTQRVTATKISTPRITPVTAQMIP
jgi:hypothetical protein